MILTHTSVPVRRITPYEDGFFFGYYDLQPYNMDETLHLAHKSSFVDKVQDRGDEVQIGVIERLTGKFNPITKTKAWNFQQGAMLQWNPQAADREIIYNDIVDGEHVGVVLDIYTGKKRFLEKAVANVTGDGRYGISINMSRLFDFRPGYGYAEPMDPFFYQKHSKEDGVSLVDIETGKAKLVLSLDEIWDFSGGFFEEDQKIGINHITFNKSGDRFVCLVRNFPAQGAWKSAAWYTATITANRDGSDMYLLSDYGVQSHYYWMNDEDILFFSNGKEVNCARGWANTYILKDKTYEGQLLADGFFRFDNHMSTSPDGKLMLTDSYPEYGRMSQLMVYNFEKNHCVHLGNYYSIERNCTDIRCDLHPRWSRNGKRFTFDSTHEGFRGIYEVELDMEMLNEIFAKEYHGEAIHEWRDNFK